MSSDSLHQRFKSNNIPLEQLSPQLFQEWKEILNATFNGSNNDDNTVNGRSCWYAIQRDQISKAMCFVLSQTNGDDGPGGSMHSSKYLVHIMELLFSQISPIERAKEIREVAWRLHQTTNQNNNNNNVNECIQVIQRSCRRLLIGLFVISDILMNLSHSSKQHQQLRFIIASFFDANNFLQELAEFVVMTKRREIYDQVAKDEVNNGNRPQQQQQQGIIQLNLSSANDEDPVFVVVGWIRELWAMWRAKSIFPAQFIEKIENFFGFLLETPALITGGK